MEPDFILAGQLQRNTILPFMGKPSIDIPGGDLLYAAAGFLVWEEGAGLLARAGEDYPHDWLQRLSKSGLDTNGIHILPETIDLQNFIAYNEKNEPSYSNPVSHFAKRGLPVPKQLSNYHSSPPAAISQSAVNSSSPRPKDIPPSYRNASNIHLCAMEFATINRFVSTFRENQAAILTLEPSKEWMHPDWWPQIRLLLNGLTAFIPSEDELRTLFLE